MMWGAIPLLAGQGFAAMRSRRAWFRLPPAGGLAGVLCMAFFDPPARLGFDAVFLTLLGVCYAVIGGVMATAVQSERSGK